MPELPEVETTLRGIAPHTNQQTIKAIIVRQPRLRWLVDPNIQCLVNSTITHCERRAKYIIMHTHKGAIIWHLGMSGSMKILPRHLPAEKHDHIDIIYHNNTLLRYTDPRRFGACLYVKTNPLQHKLLQNLGPEPLSDDFHIDYLYPICQQKSIAIKQIIMDSHIVTGVGNIYACEALFHSGIHPARKANNIAKKRLSELIRQIKNILQLAIKQGGTTLKDFTQSDGKPGYFKQHLHVYGRHNATCYQCKHPIKIIKQAQRSTFYCSYCQH